MIEEQRGPKDYVLKSPGDSTCLNIPMSRFYSHKRRPVRRAKRPWRLKKNALEKWVLDRTHRPQPHAEDQDSEE